MSESCIFPALWCVTFGAAVLLGAGLMWFLIRIGAVPAKGRDYQQLEPREWQPEPEAGQEGEE